jgi:hypothetical protein
MLVIGWLLLPDFDRLFCGQTFKAICLSTKKLEAHAVSTASVPSS